MLYNNNEHKIPFQKFVDEYKDTNLKISVEQKNYSIPINSILNFLNLSEGEYQDICNNDEIEYIYGVPKSHFIYAVSLFYISDNYDVPVVVAKRLKRLQSYEDYDLEAVNKLGVSKNQTIKNAEVNPILQEAIMKGMPKHYNTLEKAIYIYIRMCDILSYDEEYFATNEKGKTAKIHSDISHVVMITPENNLVVCYEFNAIYAKMLESLGINYEVYSSISGIYGAGHDNLQLRAGKFLIKADAVSPFFKSDMYYIKAGKKPEGLNCINVNKNTIEEFNNTLKKVFEEYQKNNCKQSLFADVVSAYQYIHDKSVPIPSLEDRLEMLFVKIRSSNFDGINRLSYILDLYRIMFSIEEKRKNLIITIVRNSRPESFNKEASVEVIITYNEQDYFLESGSNKYFILKSDNSLIPISKNFLLAKFYSDTYSYTQSTDHFIPGI